MLLNAKSNMFSIWFPANFFYPEIHERWQPVLKRLSLPFRTLEDFFNSSIQSVTIPNVDIPSVNQQQSQYDIHYRSGKELEPLIEKNLDVTFKLSEGYMTYWILFEQIEEFLKYKEDDVFWPSMYISFLDMHGFEILAYEFNKIVPTRLSSFDISFANTAAEFNTFNLGMRYNRFNIKRRLDDNISDVSNS